MQKIPPKLLKDHGHILTKLSSLPEENLTATARYSLSGRPILPRTNQGFHLKLLRTIGSKIPYQK